MPIPFILGGAALAAGAYGIKKGLDAKEKNDKAKYIIEKARNRFEKARELLEYETEQLRDKLNEYGEFKIEVFKEIIGNFLNLMKECANNAESEANIKKYLNKDEIIELEQANIEAIEISNSLLKGTASGALTAFGVYGTVGALASASTGTAIASLSGAAATNATLAWLGGGSLAAGGFGIAGGTMVLGGLIAGPAIAVTGLTMDSKAEKNLTKAKEFEKKVDEKVEKMLYSIEEYGIIQKYIEESKEVITNLISRYNKILDNLLEERENLYKQLYNEYLEKKNKASLFARLLMLIGMGNIKKPVKPTLCQLEGFQSLLIIVKSLKEILQAPLMDNEGNRNDNFIEIVEQIKIRVQDETNH